MKDTIAMNRFVRAILFPILVASAGCLNTDNIVGSFGRDARAGDGPGRDTVGPPSQLGDSNFIYSPKADVAVSDAIGGAKDVAQDPPPVVVVPDAPEDARPIKDGPEADLCTNVEMVWYVDGVERRRDVNCASGSPSNTGFCYSFPADACDGYRCLVGSEVDSACYSSQECPAACGGTCVLISTMRKQCSKADAGVIDAGVIDAGVIDAGVIDAGVVDAGVIAVGPPATLWTRQMGTAHYDRAAGVASDRAGNVYVVGSTDGELDGNVSAGADDAFLVKFDGTGAKQWVRQFGTSGSDYANGIAIDLDGNVYVVGSLALPVDESPGGALGAVFAAKYDGNGVRQWLSRMGTSRADCATSVATDHDGNVYVVGAAYGGLDGNPFAGINDLFVVKLDRTGAQQWTREMGTPLEDVARGVATDATGNVYVAASTQGELDGNASAGGEDLVLLKFDGNGAKQWIRQMGTADMDIPNGVATDSTGNIYMTGSTQAGLDGNPYGGGEDLFVVKYDSTGTKQWTRQMGTAGIEAAFGIVTDSSGNVYAAGFTYGALDGNVNAGEGDFFVLKYDPTGTKQWIRQMGSTANDYATGIGLDGDGNICLAGTTLGGLDGNESAGHDDFFVVKLLANGR